MLIIRDLKHRDGPPAWMLDEHGQPAADLHACADPEGDLYGLGSPLLLGTAPARAWSDIGDGYQARIVKPLDVAALRRAIGWGGCVPVRAVDGREWPALAVLDGGGNIILSPRYDAQWRQVWTPEQSLAIERAQAARQALAAAVETGSGLDAAAACAWTADILSAAMHLTPVILGALHLLDQALILGVLRVAAGFQIPEELET